MPEFRLQFPLKQVPEYAARYPYEDDVAVRCLDQDGGVRREDTDPVLKEGQSRQPLGRRLQRVGQQQQTAHTRLLPVLAAYGSSKQARPAAERRGPIAA